MDDFIMWIGILGIVVGLPWLLLHYITKWKQAPRITDEDEKLLDELHHLALRLEDRMQTVERIIAADNPDFNKLSAPTPRLNERLTDHELSRRN